MSDAQKAPWQKLASAASKKYAATKPTVAKAKPKPAVAKPKAAVAKAKAKLTVTKPKAKVKLSAAKPKTMPKASAAKTTKRKIAGTKTQPKTIKKTKVWFLAACRQERYVNVIITFMLWNQRSL